MSGSAFDGFGDVIQSEAGIFQGSSGLGAYDSVRHSVTPGGLVVEVHCEACGFPRQVEVSFEELMALKYNLSPHEAYQHVPQLQQHASMWRLPTQQALSKGVKPAWMPASLRCRCGQPFHRPHITPGECEGHIQTALQRGFVQHNQLKPIANHCFQVARQHGRA